MASYNGDAGLLGLATVVDMIPVPDEVQVTAFFGLTGVYSLWGGGRGRAFRVAGVLTGATVGDLAAARASILSYADGVGRVLVDNDGVNWSDVRFTGEFRWTGGYGIAPPNGYWARPYEALFAGNL